MKILLVLLLCFSTTPAFSSPLKIPNCALVNCALPPCPKDLVVPVGECCPACPCPPVCPSPNCGLFERIVFPPGECCPRCELDCSTVLCLLPDCPAGQVAVVPEGECCPRCEPCSTVQCSLSDCPAGQVAVVPEGECCPQCQCPHNCTAEFCKENPTAICSRTGPREIPGCTGTCNLSYCNACFHHAPFLPPPSSRCKQCDSYMSDTKCFRNWAKCTGREHISMFGDEVNEKLDFLCYSPPCPFKG